MSPAPALGSDLPRLLLITDRSQARATLDDVVAAAVEGGCRLVVVREKDLPEREQAALVDRLAPIVHDAGGRVLCAGRPLGESDGVHLPGPSSESEERRPDVPPAGLVGRSCHSLVELDRAAALGADYATVSPVFASASKPGYGPALGLHGLAGLADASTLPVFALAGIEEPSQVADCRRAGAHGVAIMGAVMRSADPSALTAALLDATVEVDA